MDNEHPLYICIRNESIRIMTLKVAEINRKRQQYQVEKELRDSSDLQKSHASVVTQTNADSCLQNWDTISDLDLPCAT
jgi:hypothetical protein